METQHAANESSNSLNGISNKLSSSNLDMSKRVGETVEKVGEKVERAGFRKLGDAIEHIGEGIEHLDEKKISDLAGTISQKGSDLVVKIYRFIQKRPLTLLVGAFTVSYIADRLLFSNRGTEKPSSL